VVAAALVVRVGAVVATPHYRPRHDDRDYDRIACWVALHGVPPTRPPPFPGATTCATAHAQPARRHRLAALTAYRPPLWPVALGATYALAAHLPIARWTAGRLLQALIGVAIVALIGAIAARLWGSGTGVVATALAAGFLPLVLDGATLISEPLFTALALGAVLAALEHRRRPGERRWAAAVGVLVGLATLTRSTGVILALPLAAALWSRPRWGWTPAIFVACAALVVAPWAVRNALVLHAFVPVSTETGTTLLGTYNSASLQSRRCRGCWVLLSTRRRFSALTRRVRNLDEVARDQLGRSLTVRFIRAHPAFPVQVAWRNSLRLLELGGRWRTRFGARTIDVSPRAAVVGAVELWIIAGLALIGGTVAVRRRLPGWLIALPVILWITTVLVQSETPRFRAPLDPFLLLLAACAIATLGESMQTRRALAA
jgi:hypothetical protein